MAICKNPGQSQPSDSVKIRGVRIIPESELLLMSTDPIEEILDRLVDIALPAVQADITNLERELRGIDRRSNTDLLLTQRYIDLQSKLDCLRADRSALQEFRSRASAVLERVYQKAS